MPVPANHEFFVERQVGFDGHQSRHQFGDRSNRQDGVRVLLEQDFVRVLVDDQCNR